MVQIRVPTVQEHVELEYRIAVLEGMLRWLLSNAYLTEPINQGDLERIYWDAADAVRARYPDAEIEYEKLAPSQESLFSE